MKRRQAAIAAGLVSVVAVVVWLAWPTQAPPSPAVPVVAAPDASVSSPDAAVRERVDAAPPEAPHPVKVIDAVTREPLPDVQVLLSLPTTVSVIGHFAHSIPHPLTRATTDAAGVAAVRTDHDLESVTVRASKDFYEDHEEAFQEGMTIALDPLPRLRGRVVNERGAPVSAANVTTTRHKLKATTDGDGRFEIAAPETEWLYAEKDGAFGHGEWTDDKKKLVVLTLSSATQKRRVVDTAGQPLAGVAIDFKLGGLEVHRETGADGIWKMARVDARPDVTFKKQGYATHETEIALEDTPENVRLTRACKVEGVVLRADGTPAAGAEIIGLDSFVRMERAPPRLTGSDGRFAKDDVEAGELRVSARLDGEVDQVSQRLAEGASVEVRLVLHERPREVLVQANDARGRGLPGYLWKAVAQRLGEDAGVVPSSYGTLELLPGRYRVTVIADNGARGEAEVTVAREGEPPVVEVTLDAAVKNPLSDEEDDAGDPPRRGNHALKVRVRGPSGVPVGSVEVSCLDDHGPTREDGVYDCRFDADENTWPLQVRAVKGEESGMARAQESDKELEVVLRAGRDIKVRFEGTLPKRPCKLLVNSPTERDEVEVTANPLLLTGRSAVRTFLCLECEGELESDPAARLGCAVAEGQSEVTIPIGAPGTLSLKVLDAAGKPVEQPLLYIDRVGSDPVAPGGEVRVPVPPGTHLLVINVQGKKDRAELPFTIRTGETTALGTVQLK